MAILYGTTGDGTTLPVLVDQFGNLLAKGIDGPPGPPGPPGVGELPSGATDGALLGWQDGELVWITEPPPPIYVPGFVPIIYTGNGGTQAITTGFSPDLVWFKNRLEQEPHVITDVLMGTGNSMSSDLTQGIRSDLSSLTSFDADGFTLAADKNTNRSGIDYVAWCWDAGNTTVTNNDGTIESQVRSNGDFSVVSYVGTGSSGSVGHGLDTAPKFLIVKNTGGGAQNWFVWHTSLANPTQEGLFLNTSNPVTNFGEGGALTTVPNQVINFGIDSIVSRGDDPFICYAWAETPGVSNFGEYKGTGSRQTIYTVFRPSLVIIKSTGNGNWFMLDNARGAANALYANLADMETATGAVEFLDDGFQLLFGLPGINESNETYIYAAFANPSDAAFAQRQLRRQARQEERQQNKTQPR